MQTHNRRMSISCHTKDVPCTLFLRFGAIILIFFHCSSRYMERFAKIQMILLRDSCQDETRQNACNMRAFRIRELSNGYRWLRYFSTRAKPNFFTVEGSSWKCCAPRKTSTMRGEISQECWGVLISRSVVGRPCLALHGAMRVNGHEHEMSLSN